MKDSDISKQKAMRRFGLIGYPLSHSFSPGYFAAKFEREKISDASYGTFPLETIEEFKALMSQGLCGLNVTIPYKEQVIPYLDDLSVEARAIGAVNTILFRNERSTGYNTDVYGFEQSLLTCCKGEIPQKALVLGTGGASKAVQYVLRQHAVDYLLVSRSKGDVNYREIDEDCMGSRLLIVNTTPLGMYPKVDQSPDLPYDFLTRDHILYDLVYNPEKTLFLSKGLSRGAQIKNGLEMLQLQAEKSWEIWNK